MKNGNSLDQFNQTTAPGILAELLDPFLDISKRRALRIHREL